MRRNGFRIALFLSLLLPAGADTAFSQAGNEKEITIEEFLQRLSSVPDVMKRKDPFVEEAPPFQAAAVETGAPADSAPLLERYPVTSYSVVAVLLGDQYPRALLRLPDAEKGKVVIVREKDRLGNREGVIAKITQEGLRVVQSVRSPFGFVDKTEIMLKVGAGTDPQVVPPKP